VCSFRRVVQVFDGNPAMTTYYVAESELQRLVREREGTSIFAPAVRHTQGGVKLSGLAQAQGFSWMDSTGTEPSLTALSQPRAAQSPKGFYLPAAESMGRYGSGTATATSVETQSCVLVGVRACELRARRYLDKVMLDGPFADPLYAQRREATTIVSCDCVDCAESCFCTLVGGRPYATTDYDANLTPIDGGYVVDVATERGEQWLGGGDKRTFPEATAEQLARRDRGRKEMVERVTQQNARFSFAASDEAQPKLPDDADEAWQRFAADCVECGACTNICPTCYCFYLYDQVLGPEEFERVRTWDSCLLSTYHRMAGGVGMKLTPRPRLSSRLANRVLHKFTYSPEQCGLLGCVGCGRCIDACLGAIDIREVVQALGAAQREQGK